MVRIREGVDFGRISAAIQSASVKTIVAVVRFKFLVAVVCPLLHDIIFVLEECDITRDNNKYECYSSENLF